jgi:hypothetical protein
MRRQATQAIQGTTRLLSTTLCLPVGLTFLVVAAF